MILHKKGELVYIAVYDCFSGYVKPVKDGVFSCTVKVIDVLPCYPRQLTYKKGDIVKLKRKEICCVDNKQLRHAWSLRSSVKDFFRVFKIKTKENDLPF